MSSITYTNAPAAAFTSFQLCTNCGQPFIAKEPESIHLCPACRDAPPPDCPCGGPAGHVPGGIHCRKP